MKREEIIAARLAAFVDDAVHVGATVPSNVHRGLVLLKLKRGRKVRMADLFAEAIIKLLEAEGIDPHQEN